MSCKNFWLRIIPFSLALVFGLATANILQKENSAGKNEEDVKAVNTIYSGVGIGSCPGKSSNTFTGSKTKEEYPFKVKPLGIIAKPKANYTDAARQNQVQGTVTLRVTFSASGQIGSVSPVSELPDGLTEQALAAARQIKFEPLMKNGVTRTTIKLVEYSFIIY